MNEFLKVFGEENWLQLADHIVTILFGVASFILAILAIRLTRKDKAKTIAINELQAQTKKLEELYLYQIQPKFVANSHSSGYIYIKNIGGDCYNLKISPIEDLVKRGNPFESWENFFSSLTEKTINWQTYGENNFKFIFEDKFGNKFEQILYTSKKKFSNLKKING